MLYEWAKRAMIIKYKIDGNKKQSVSEFRSELRIKPRVSLPSTMKNVLDSMLKRRDEMW
jgi:hypothetical protein